MRIAQLFSALFFIQAIWQCAVAQYLVGTGIADITGPVAEIMLMGYAKTGQTGEGILQRIYARAFIVAEPTGKRVVFVNTDTQSMGDIVKKRVIQELQALYGNTLYTEENVMLSSTHSHSGMGGYLQHTLYELSVLGWIEETTRPMVTGIVNSIKRAHEKLQAGSVTLTVGELLNTNINRSPAAYLLNPADERANYKYDVDKDMTLLGFLNANGDPLGLLNWFAVHGVSVNNTNHLINGDNKGYAAYSAEKHFNGDALPGKGPFVAAFAQANEGDVSPNTLGAFCTGTNIPCDGTRENECGNESCIGRGPGWTEGLYESNRIIGQNQANKAIELFENLASGQALSGPIDFRQKFWAISDTIVTLKDGNNVSTCVPAMGYAFAAGTTDGPALSGFYQNTTEGTWFWDLIADVLKKPSNKQKECQAPKPILLNTGEITIPYDWQPKIIDVQLLRVGQLFIAGVPSEMTTMSGRRLRNAIKQTLESHGIANPIVIQSGPANGYASYCATYEEYQMQRYEGASTPFGPHTLDAYIQVFTELAAAIATGAPVNQTVSLPDFTSKAFNLSPGHGPDSAPLGKKFGSIVFDTLPAYTIADLPTVSATFVAGNPRNDGMLDGTYMTVEKKNPDGSWTVIRTDDDYDTRFRWAYTSRLLGLSRATLEWVVDTNVTAGTYRLGYFGHNMRFLSGEILPHQGYSSEFTLQ